MKNENTEKIRERVLLLIESEFASDAEFERELGIPEKTVNNWRRGRSSSFMSMLPTLSEKFGVNVGELFDMTPKHDTSELSDDEIELLKMYRRSRTMPQKMRTALRQTLESVINLYIQTVAEQKKSKKKQK